MVLADVENLRDVVAFPKTQRGQDLLTGAPTPVAHAQLDELSIRVALPDSLKDKKASTDSSPATD